MNTVETLKAAKVLISDPAKWTQGSYARAVRGHEVGPSEPDAVCWCSYGALQHVRRASSDSAWGDALIELMTAMGGGIAAFNDNNDHAAVMAAFDRAIAQAEADAKGA